MGIYTNFIIDRMMRVSYAVIILAAVAAMFLVPIQETNGDYTDNDISDILESDKESEILSGKCHIGRDTVIPYGKTVILMCGDYYNGGEPVINPDGTVYSKRDKTPHTSLNTNGYTLTVKGTLIVNAVTNRPISDTSELTYNAENWNITGGWARIVNSGSIIISENGSLYNYGIIEGSGSVTADSGSVLGDLYTLDNWRFGSTTRSCLEKEIYPLNMYSMNNISCRITVNCGALYTGLLKVYLNSSFYSGTFDQIGNDNGLIRLKTDAYAEKTSSDNRTAVKITGGALFSSSKISINGMSQSTENYSMPLKSMDLILNNGIYEIDSIFKAMTGSVITAVNSEIRVTEKGSLSIYDYYDDRTSWKGTEYPDLPPAYLSLNDSILTNYGTYAGRIFITGQSDFENYGKTVSSTLESTGIEGYGDYIADEIWHRTVIVYGEPSRYLTGYFTDAGLSQPWNGMPYSDDSVLYSGISSRAVAEDQMAKYVRISNDNIQSAESHSEGNPAIFFAVIALTSACGIVIMINRKDVFALIKKKRKIIGIAVVSTIAVSCIFAATAVPSNNAIDVSIESFDVKSEGEDIHITAYVCVESGFSFNISDLSLNIEFDDPSFEDISFRSDNSVIKAKSSSMLVFYGKLSKTSMVTVVNSVLDNSVTTIDPDVSISGKYLGNMLCFKADVKGMYKLTNGNVEVFKNVTPGSTEYLISGLNMPLETNLSFTVSDGTESLIVEVDSNDYIAINTTYNGSVIHDFFTNVDKNSAVLIMDGNSNPISSDLIAALSWFFDRLEDLS